MERKGYWRNLGALVCKKSLVVKKCSYINITLFTDIHKIGASDNDQCYLVKETMHYGRGINAQSI